jgi:anti-sigma factor RsiW
MMACVHPPELPDRQLLAYLDGEATARIVAHLSQCPACRQRARQLAHLQAALTSQLYRLECPTPHELGEYQLSVLTQAQAAAVAAHLIECPHCLAEVAQLNSYLADLSAELKTSIVERARVLVARLIDGGNRAGAPAFAPAMAGIRGEDAEPSIYQAGDLQITIMVEPDDERPGRQTLLGLLVAAVPGDLQAQLWQATQLVASAPVDAAGNFILANLTPGDYELTLYGPDLEIHVEALKV